MCIDPNFPYTNEENYSHVMWRIVKPTRQQSDFGPKEWIISPVPVPEDFSGKLHYKSMLGTRSGTFPFSYPAPGVYEEVNIAYRAPYGNAILAFMLFCLVAGTVWGSLGLAIKKMNESGEEEASIVGALD